MTRELVTVKGRERCPWGGPDVPNGGRRGVSILVVLLEDLSRREEASPRLSSGGPHVTGLWLASLDVQQI